MKNILKNKLLYFFIILSILFSCCIYTQASDVEAIDETSKSTQTQSTFNFISSDLYKFDTEITITETVDGNVFAMGDIVTIDGEVGGDVFVMADTVTFTENSYIYGNIFALANNVVMNGAAYDIYSISPSFTLGETGIVARDIKITTENTYINGSIRRNAYIYTNSLTFAEDGTNLIKGDLEYTSRTEFEIPEGIVGGNVKFTEDTSDEVDTANLVTSYINNVLSTLLYSLVVILLAVWLAPKFIDKSVDLLKQKPVKCFGIGLLSTIILTVVPFAFLLLTYGLGIGISFAVIAVFVLLLTISKTVFGIALAKRFTCKIENEKPYHLVLFTLLAVLVISLLELVPYIGGLIGFIVCMAGFGVIVLSLVSKKVDNEEVKIEEINE